MNHKSELMVIIELLESLPNRIADETDRRAKAKASIEREVMAKKIEARDAILSTKEPGTDTVLGEK